MPRTTNNINTNIKLGADPEFVWFNGNQFVSASSVTTGRHAETDELGVDGACSTGEMRPKPGTPMHVWHNINKILKEAARQPYDMYAGSGRDQATGGHIHFSGIPHTALLLNRLDKFITIPLNEVSNCSSRHRFYGALSEVRPQPHGWEYRSPCSWIVHPIIAKGVLRIAWVLALATEMGRLSEINEVEDLLRFGNEIDHPCATTGNIREYFAMLRRMKRANIKLEQVEVFQAWKKKERRGAGTSATRTTVPIVHFSSDDFNMENVKRAFERLGNAISERIQSVSVVGASADRTSEKVVFVPESYENDILNAEPGVSNVIWDRPCFGLSYSLREEPEVAARALYNVLKREETITSSNGNAAILNIVEGRRQCAA